MGGFEADGGNTGFGAVRTAAVDDASGGDAADGAGFSVGEAQPINTATGVTSAK
jgi:hypothetical protein